MIQAGPEFCPGPHPAGQPWACSCQRPGYPQPDMNGWTSFTGSAVTVGAGGGVTPRDQILAVIAEPLGLPGSALPAYGKAGPGCCTGCYGPSGSTCPCLYCRELARLRDEEKPPPGRDHSPVRIVFLAAVMTTWILVILHMTGVI